MEVFNRKARYDYFIEEEYEAGIVLTGTEVKSIRAGKCNINDSYALIRKGEAFLVNMFINLYKEGNIFNHEEKRSRKLLLHKNEITKLKAKLEQEGYTLVALKLYFKKNKVKILIGLAKGKKNFDKREVIKERDIKRKLNKSIKERNYE